MPDKRARQQIAATEAPPPEPAAPLYVPPLAHSLQHPDFIQAQTELGRVQAALSLLKPRLADTERILLDREHRIRVLDEQVAERTRTLRERQDELEIALQEGHAEQKRLSQLCTATEKVRFRHEEAAARAMDTVRTLQIQATALQTKGTDEQSLDERLALLQASVEAHETTLQTELAAIETARIERAKIAKDCELAQAAIARQREALQAHEEDLGLQSVSHSQQAEAHLRASQELAEREQRLTERERLHEESIAVNAERVERYRTQETELAHERTRQTQERQLLEKLQAEATKQHEAASAASVRASLAQSLIQTQSEAQASSQRAIEARLAAITEAERLLDQKAAQLDARQATLKRVSIELATAETRLKAAAATAQIAVVIPTVPQED